MKNTADRGTRLNYTCPKCGLKIKGRGPIRKVTEHEQSCVGDVILKCRTPGCPKTFHSPLGLQKHETYCAPQNQD